MSRNRLLTPKDPPFSFLFLYRNGWIRARLQFLGDCVYLKLQATN